MFQWFYEVNSSGTMGKFFNLIFREKYSSEGLFVAELESLNLIRDNIINTIYFISGIFGTLTLVNTIRNITKSGFQTFYLFQLGLFISVWVIYFFRHKISLNWKASIFFIIFFILAASINFKFGIVSGALNFVFITTLITLIFGWKAGVASIVLTLIIRFFIGFGYYKGILKYEIDLNEYAYSSAGFITNIMGALVISSITVFVISRFYNWLIFSVRTVSEKAKELSHANNALLEAKKRAEENDRLKSVFLANMSHEIRTPMNAIVGFSCILSKPDLSEEKRNRYISIIHDRSYDLLRIIEDILDISKIEVGQLKLIETHFHIAPMMYEIYDYYQLKKEKLNASNGVVFKYFVSEDVKKLIISLDRQRLNQIFTNLLDNAFKFTKKGEIEFGCKMQNQSMLLFWVKDTGIGIPKDKQVIVFDRFRQADDYMPTNQYGGTGLGLSIVQGITKLMGGKIWLESEVDIGSTFFFALPLKLSEGTGLN